MRAHKFITGHVIYNPAYTYKFQLKTTEVVDRTIQLTSPKCNSLVKKAMGQAARLTLHRVGWSLMSKVFKTCQPFDGSDPRNVSNIMESLIGNQFIQNLLESLSHDLYLKYGNTGCRVF